MIYEALRDMLKGMEPEDAHLIRIAMTEAYHAGANGDPYEDVVVRLFGVEVERPNLRERLGAEDPHAKEASRRWFRKGLKGVKP